MFQRLASPSGFDRRASPLAPAYIARTGLAEHIAPGTRAPAGHRISPASHFETAADESDPLAQMAQADAADASLMRLVLVAASATLALALLSSLL